MTKEQMEKIIKEKIRLLDALDEAYMKLHRKLLVENARRQRTKRQSID